MLQSGAKVYIKTSDISFISFHPIRKSKNARLWHLVFMCSKCYICDGSTEAAKKWDVFVQIVTEARSWNDMHRQLKHVREGKNSEIFLKKNFHKDKKWLYGLVLAVLRL